MSVPPYEDPRSTRPRPKVDAGRLWTGGVATAAVAALLATGLMHLLLLSTPRPGQFFTWIVGLLTLIAVILPFLTDAEPATRSRPRPSTWASAPPSGRWSRASPGVPSGS